MPDLRFYPAHTPLKKNTNDNHPGVKRVLNLSMISRGPVDVWDGSNVDDLRKMALEFVGTKLDKKLATFKPVTAETVTEMAENRESGTNLVVFIEKQ